MLAATWLDVVDYQLDRAGYCAGMSRVCRPHVPENCMVRADDKRENVARARVGTIIFKQKRIGRSEREFTIFKLRTMAAPSASCADDNVRLTAWARLLRLWRIDELPQVLNILRGEMAIFGPRPLPRAEHDLLPPDIKMERFAVRPGLFSPTHVILGELTHERRINEERIYFERCGSSGRLITSIRYLIRIAVNVAFRGARGRMPGEFRREGDFASPDRTRQQAQ